MGVQWTAPPISPNFYRIVIDNPGGSIVETTQSPYFPLLLDTTTAHLNYTWRVESVYDTTTVFNPAGEASFVISTEVPSMWGRSPLIRSNHNDV